LPPGPARDLVDLFIRLRRGRRLSGGQLAVAAGLSSSHVSDVLRGIKAPSPHAAAKIAHALGATSDQERKAYQLAEQLIELNRYHRARRSPPADALPGSP
jgi:transcriptional regulator with XRE-family HTH domain